MDFTFTHCLCLFEASANDSPKQYGITQYTIMTGDAGLLLFLPNCFAGAGLKLKMIFCILPLKLSLNELVSLPDYSFLYLYVCFHKALHFMKGIK